MFAKRLIFTALPIIFLTACMSLVQRTIPVSPDLSSTDSETTTVSVVPEITSTPRPTRTPRPTATLVPLELQKIEAFPNECSDMVQGLPGEKLSEVSYVPSGFCFHGELDIFEIGDQVYVAQVIMSDDPRPQEAFRIIDVTDVEEPVVVGAWQWTVPTFTSDVKAFRQGDRWFLAVSRDPYILENAPESLCRLMGGIAIIEVTEPSEARLINLLTGESTASKADEKWCNSHTAEVSRDAEGNGAYLYVSAIDIFDLRVLDIRDLDNVTEVGHYTHPDAGFYNERNIFFVHDTTIVGDRVYVAYWSAGLVILDRQALEAGRRVIPLNPLDSIDPWGLYIHHAFPTVDENFVFVEDEFPSRAPESRLRLYDIRNLGDPKEVAAIILPDSFGAPHNLLVSGDLLFVGWYQDGVRVFKYDTSEPDNPTVEPYAFKAVRSEKTLNSTTQTFDGIWGVRLHDFVVEGQPKTCIYASDMSWGLIILAMEPIGSR